MHEGILYLGLLDDEAIELDVAALALSAIDHPGIDLQPYRDILGMLAVRVAELAGDVRTPQERALALARVIGGDYGFAGDRAGYDAPVNTDLIRVVDRRRGLPVSLSILFVATARRLGWPADALNMPGHVLVRIGDDDAQVVIDPFEGGMPVARERLAAIQALQPAPKADAYPPMTNREVLVRLLLNQATRAEQTSDAVRAEALYERMTVIAPDHGQGWWELARLQLSRGRVGDARASLSAMLEVTRDPERRDTIAATLEAIAGEIRN
jgi:regulator of sirC expression with transglutaminase-like and TPR domain